MPARVSWKVKVVRMFTKVLHDKNKKGKRACIFIFVLTFLEYSSFLRQRYTQSLQTKTLCRGIWQGVHPPARTSTLHVKVHVVVAYCKASLMWLSMDIHHLIETYPYVSVTDVFVYTKCGIDPTDAPPGAVLKQLSNVGRCDHTYAHHMADLSKNNSNSDPDVIVFVKDSTLIHQQAKSRTLYHMILQAASNVGFACGRTPSIKKERFRKYGSLSLWHHTNTLLRLRKLSYPNAATAYRHEAQQREQFAVSTNNMRNWLETSLAFAPPVQTIIPVCYGGVFATSTRNIRRHKTQLFDKIVASLSRGDNIQESHYAERLWAHLLSAQLDTLTLENIISLSDGFISNYDSGLLGTLYSYGCDAKRGTS